MSFEGERVGIEWKSGVGGGEKWRETGVGWEGERVGIDRRKCGWERERVGIGVGWEMRRKVGYTGRGVGWKGERVGMDRRNGDR